MKAKIKTIVSEARICLVLLLHKYKPMMLVKDIISGGKRKRKCSISDKVPLRVIVPEDYSHSFADIDELYTKYGIDCSDEEEHRRTSTNVGYINRNCAEHMQTETNVEPDETLEKETSIGCTDTNVQNIEKEQLDEHNIENFETSFGRKGKNVGEFQDATNVTYVSRNRILVTDMINHRMQLCNNQGLTSVVYNGKDISEPWATCVTSDGHIAMTSRHRKCVMVMSMDGDVMWSFGSGFFQCPSGVCVDKQDNFIVTDAVTNRVSIHSCTGQFIKYIGNASIKAQQFSKPRYVCCSPTGDIIVSDSGSHSVKIFDTEGHFVRSIGTFGRSDGQLKTPYGVCTDSLGHVIVADHYNNRISMFTREGAFVCHVITEKHGLTHPQGIALSPDLNMYVTHGHMKACEVKVYRLKCSYQNVVVDV